MDKEISENINRQLSILIVNERVYPVYTGGMELATYHLTKALIETGQKVKIMSATEHKIRDIELPEFINVIYTSRIKYVKFLVFLIFGFLRILKNNKRINILHGQPIFPSGLLVIIAGKILRKPTILWARGADIYQYLDNPFSRPVVKWTIFGATRIIALTDDLKKRIQLHCGRKPVTIVPNGVSLPKIIRFNKIKFFRKYGYSEDITQKKIILFVGRLVSFKGLQFLLDAMSEIRNKNPNMTLIIIGSGPEKEKLAEICRNRQITKYVKFIGQIPWIDVLKWHQVSYLFVYPTLRGQGMNNAVLEAMASGLPVIATNVGGLPSIITNGETGILINSKSSRLLEREIHQAILNPQRVQNIGQNARNYVEINHSWKKIARTYLTICSSVFNKFYSKP